jgi:hypothetical protein
MIFWPFCAFIWFKNIEKTLLQMTRGFLQLESTILIYSHNFDVFIWSGNHKFYAYLDYNYLYSVE